jgi:CHAD domain-containing protein
VSTRRASAAALPPSPWLGQLAAQAASVRRGDDPESVHRLRVAAGRLDVWLRMGAMRALRDDLRWLRRAAARVRDVDVLLASEPPALFAIWLSSERASARRALLDLLASPRFAALLSALALLPPVPSSSARAYVRAARARALERGRRCLRADAGVPEFHRLRRALRRLRYAHEWLGTKQPGLEALQDELGALNDAASARAWLGRSPMSEELGGYRVQLERDVRRRREAARRAWRRQRLRRRGQGKS